MPDVSVIRDAAVRVGEETWLAPSEHDQVLVLSEAGASAFGARCLEAAARTAAASGAIVAGSSRRRETRPVVVSHEWTSRLPEEAPVAVWLGDGRVRVFMSGRHFARETVAAVDRCGREAVAAADWRQASEVARVV